jgi:uncharacterized phage-associated protein
MIKIKSPIRFKFDCRKTIQAAALLAKNEPSKRISRMRLLKLLYIADREALLEIGRSISGDALAAMKKGPILSGFYDMIKGESSHSGVLEKYFLHEDYFLRLVKSPGNDRMNRYEIRKLQEISQRHKDHDDEELSDLTHEFPEWEKHNPGNSSKPIPVEDVLSALSRSDKAEIVRENAALKDAVDKLWDAK